MRDFDAFTMNIAEGDPLKREALERGTIVNYWDTAVAYVTKVVAAKEQADRAAKKHSVPSRRG